MSARIIEGGPVAARIRADIQARLAVADEPPLLQVLLAGDDPGSRWYAQAKVKLGARLGIAVRVERFPDAVSTSALLAAIADWNNDPAIHGILTELPLPSGVDKARVLAAIDPHKDVDGVGPVNRGLLFGGAERHALLPATPLACLELLTEVPVQPAGKRAVVVGRGDTVGRPLAALLISRHATVTVCHTRTNDLAAVVREADLVFAAAGRPGVITGDMVRPGATVIDAGITEVDGALTGDVDWDNGCRRGRCGHSGARRRRIGNHLDHHEQRAARPLAAAGECRPLMNDAPHAERLLQLPVTAFLDRTASASATPGGGSVAAVTGALASALVAMVARLTDRKKGYEQAWELAAEAVRRADRLTTELQAAALEDVHSFEAYLAALRLPKRSPEERQARSAAVAAASRRATAAPLAIAGACAEVLTVAEGLAPVANRHAVSDIGAAAHLAAAAAGAALLTAEINLGSAPTGTFFDHARQRAAELREKVGRIAPAVISTVETRI